MLRTVNQESLRRSPWALSVLEIKQAVLAEQESSKHLTAYKWDMYKIS